MNVVAIIYVCITCSVPAEASTGHWSPLGMKEQMALCCLVCAGTFNVFLPTFFQI